jgi:pimeloyl-ACP methyl ester carboxylesterase
MTPARQPHVREAGSGPAVVCLHCNGASGGQWTGLMARLGAHYRVVAPDLYGSGASPAWDGPRLRTLGDELDLIEPVLHEAGDGVVLVGHSHGAAVALAAALRHPRRVRALALYEPTLFALVDRACAPPNGADGIRLACRAAKEALARGDAGEAARHFIDFWGGPGSWDRTPQARRPAIEQAVRDVAHWEHALFTEPRTAADFAALEVPVLYLTGSDSPASARAVADVLLPALPRVRHHDLPGLGHMGPVTHAALVNEQIAGFLATLDGE